MTKLRWGILATGWIAGIFADDLVANGFTITAVGSRSAEKSEAFADRLGASKAHGSYEALAADPDVDAIYIATPHPFHVRAAELCIKAGKHVLVEKPLALNAAQARYLGDLARNHDVLVMEAMWTRFLPHMVRLRDILRSGQLGPIRSIIATHTQDLPDDPGHRLNDLALGGGALLDLGVYPVSFAFDLLGRPDRIFATGRLKETGADASASVIFEYPGSATALLLATSDAGGSNRAEINCAEGYIEIEGVWYEPSSLKVHDGHNTLLETFESPEITGRGMHFQAAEFERVVASGKMESALMPLEESIAVMAALDEIRRQIGVSYPGE